MIKEQYPQQGMKQQGMKCTPISFQFVPSAGDEKLKIILDHESKTAAAGWKIAFQSSQQVYIATSYRSIYTACLCR